MAVSTPSTPLQLNDPGVLLWAPLASSLPTNTVTGSVFTDTWPVAWIPLGMTDAGSTWTMSLTVEPQEAAETFDPIAYRTTGRAATVEFSLLNFTGNNFARALNGATVTTVSGSGATTLTQIDPPNPGSEVRCMIGWESLDSTVRLIGFQCINSGDLAIAMQKAPARGMLPFTLNLEKPSSTQPFRMYTAGATRAGS